MINTGKEWDWMDKKMNIKLIYGSDTNNTEYVIDTYVMSILEQIGEVDLKSVSEVTEKDWHNADLYILSIPTWYDGELQSDWEMYFETFKEIDFSNKTVAVFGLGDQWGYDEWFCDGVGILAKVVESNGGTVIGKWARDDSYDFETNPKVLIDENTFWGLPLDEDNQSDLTQERVTNWLEQVKSDYEIIHGK
jgi:flavodoxin I